MKVTPTNIPTDGASFQCKIPIETMTPFIGTLHESSELLCLIFVDRLTLVMLRCPASVTTWRRSSTETLFRRQVTLIQSSRGTPLP